MQHRSICAPCSQSPLRSTKTEELEYVPGRFIVNRIVRPRFACSGCEAFINLAFSASSDLSFFASDGSMPPYLDLYL